MKKINIVKESKDFENIIHNGKYFKNREFIIHVLTKEESYYRFGISVGKKISNKAVVRNKLKRQLKDIIDKNKKLYQNNQDYIIIMKRSCLNLNYQELETSFLDIMRKVNEKGDSNEK